MTTQSFKSALQDLKDKTNLDPKKDPYKILEELAKDIRETFPGKLDAGIAFGEDPNSKLIFDYRFYLMATIGNGYIYNLFSVMPSKENVDSYGYPLTVGAAFGGFPSKNPDIQYGINLGKANNAEEFRELIFKILNRPFVKNQIQTLLNQVDLYNKSREFE